MQQTKQPSTTHLAWSATLLTVFTAVQPPRTQLDAPGLLPLAERLLRCSRAAAPHRLSIARFLGLLRVGRVSRGTELASLVVKLERFKPIIGLYFILREEGSATVDGTHELFFFCVDASVEV
jgi:hypothetical protein